MATEQDFINAINAVEDWRPPALAFADWLRERGDSERARLLETCVNGDYASIHSSASADLFTLSRETVISMTIDCAEHVLSIAGRHLNDNSPWKSIEAARRRDNETLLEELEYSHSLQAVINLGLQRHAYAEEEKKALRAEWHSLEAIIRAAESIAAKNDAEAVDAYLFVSKEARKAINLIHFCSKSEASWSSPSSLARPWKRAKAASSPGRSGTPQAKSTISNSEARASPLA